MSKLENSWRRIDFLGKKLRKIARGKSLHELRRDDASK